MNFEFCYLYLLLYIILFLIHVYGSIWYGNGETRPGIRIGVLKSETGAAVEKTLEYSEKHSSILGFWEEHSSTSQEHSSRFYIIQEHSSNEEITRVNWEKS